MGCGGSKSTMQVVSLEEPDLKHTNGELYNSDSENLSLSNGTPHGNKSSHHSTQDTAEHAIFKGIAFDVELGKNKNTEALKRRPPHRLQKLENMPKLTAEMLRQKIDAAEENRKKEIDKRVRKTSNKKKKQELSKRRKKIIEAKEFAAQKSLEQKLVSYDKNRTKAQAVIVAKQQRREAKAKKVRSKAQLIKDGEDAEPVVIDPDETYNADQSEDEQWDESLQTGNFKEEQKENIPSSRNSTPNETKEFDDFYDS